MEDSTLQIYKVLDFSAAQQAVQTLETRDFSYKGIFKLFTVVSEWTEKFSVNKALPNENQLMREIGLDREQVEHFIYELCFKHKVPLLKKFITLEYDPSNKIKTETLSHILAKNTVFCRPTNTDAGSAMRYAVACNDISLASVSKAVKNNRVPFTGEKFKDFLFTKINGNRLHETYSSFDVIQLFNCPYDTNPSLKKATLESHIDPLLKRLADEKVFIYFFNNRTKKTGNQSVYLFNHREEILERIDIYIDYLRRHIIPDLQKLGVIGKIAEEEYEGFGTLATKVLHYVDDSYGDQKTVLEELLLLETYHDNFQEEQAKQQLKVKIEEILKLLVNANRMVDVNNIRINGETLSKELVPSIIANENILHAEYDDNKSFYEFILHKSCIKKAVENAKKEYRISGNDVMIRILEKMNVMSFLDADGKKEFYQIENESLFKYLPFFTRMWRTLLGNIYVTQEEAAVIRNAQKEEQKKRIMQSKVKIIQKEKTRIAEERLKSNEPSAEIVKGNDPQEFESNNPDDPDSTTAKQLAFIEEKDAKELLKRIISIIDQAWDARTLPDREYLNKALDNALSEEQLVAFLKKYGNKEVVSFIIKTKLEKFKWPVLITRTYIKRKGNALLEFAKKETDEQRKSRIPNQEKYDVYTSVEDFLGKVLKVS